MSASWQYADLDDSAVGRYGAHRAWAQLGTCCVLSAGGPTWVALQPAEPLPQWPDCWLLLMFKVSTFAVQSAVDALAIEALRRTRRHLGDPPAGGIVAFVGQQRFDYLTWPPPAVAALAHAGFARVGIAEDGAEILQLPPDRFPSAWAGRSVTRHARRSTRLVRP